MSVRRGLLSLLLFPLLLSVHATRAADYALETLADDLHHPWSLAELPDGELLVTERPGRLVLIHANGRQQPVAGVPAPYVAGQGGLFDVLLDPGFSVNRTLFLSLAEGDADNNHTAVYRAKLQGTALTAVERILAVEPDKDTPHHYGGRLLLLPDGSLLVTSGEGFEYREAAQSLDSELGKVLRINRDGSVPADNPFADRGRGKVWTYGHRNPQGIALDAQTGAVYLHEHGPRGGDEVNRLEPGSNYGWPAITHGVDYSGALVSPFSEAPGMQQPLKVWVPSIAPSGMAFYNGAAFPEWRNSLFVGALVNEEVRRLQLDDGRVTAEETLFAEIGARIRDVRAGSDGSLYLLTDEDPGRLIKVVPTPQ